MKEINHKKHKIRVLRELTAKSAKGANRIQVCRGAAGYSPASFGGIICPLRMEGGLPSL